MSVQETIEGMHAHLAAVDAQLRETEFVITKAEKMAASMTDRRTTGMVHARDLLAISKSNCDALVNVREQIIAAIDTLGRLQ